MPNNKMKRVYIALTMLVGYTPSPNIYCHPRALLWAKTFGLVKHDRILNGESIYREPK